MALYQIQLGHVYDQNQNVQLECYYIDRVPQGDLNGCIDNREITDPNRRNGTRTEIRNVILLPESVKQSYNSGTVRFKKYVNNQTLPGFISWLLENNYSLVDMLHVTPMDETTTQTFWIQYDSSVGNEFASKNLSRNFQLSKPLPVARKISRSVSTSSSKSTSSVRSTKSLRKLGRGNRLGR